MQVKRIEVGELATNCYIVHKGSKAVVIDPGADSKAILATLAALGVKLEAIINTHGHFDHVGANAAVKAATGADIYIHRDDALMLVDEKRNLSEWAGGAITSPPADILLTGGQKLILADLEFKVIHTPGHTPGGVCLQVEQVVFTGDTLFAGSVGRTDFPYASSAQLMQSLQEKIKPLPPDLVVYPGHGPTSTIGREKETNPYLAF